MTVPDAYRATVTTAGLTVAVRCELPGLVHDLQKGADDRLATVVPGDEPAADLQLVVEADHSPFGTQGWRAVTRESWHRDGEVVVADVVTSGFDCRLSWDGQVPVMTFRHRPPARTRTAALVLRSRARLLWRAALLQYPALWTASLSGRAPVHAAVVDTGPGGAALIVGASGAGKTTMVERTAATGGTWVTDNLACSDGRTAWGVVEPVRSTNGAGPATLHGRRETHLPGRVDRLEPRTLLVLRRGRRWRVARLDAAAAARELAGSTYAAGELRRYWPLHAVWSLGSGAGPVHPPVAVVADALATRAPCFAVEVPDGDTTPPAGLVSMLETSSWT